MPTTTQMLNDYDPVLLAAIAELRGAEYEQPAGGSKLKGVELLAEDLTNPASVQAAYQDAVDFDPAVEKAIDLLLTEGGEVPEARFYGEFGQIRQMGPSKMEREHPWENPAGVAEVLYFHGLIGRAFSRRTGQQTQMVVYVPSDVAPWLPHTQAPSLPDGLPVSQAAPPPRSRTLNADDSFVEDAGTFLGFLWSEQLRLTPDGPHPEDIERLVQRLQIPFDDSMPAEGVRLALLLHIANRLGWLRRTEAGLIVLTGNRVRDFLDKTRAEQRQALFEAWRDSPDWNDLCRTPELECPPNPDWKNDPLQTRTRVLNLLGRIPPNGWYHTSSLVAAVKEVEPHFQRPTGRYDEWTIRRGPPAPMPGAPAAPNTTKELLSGFEHWDDVEGALLRFLIKGPLHWLGAVDLAEPSAGDDWLFSLTNWGARWLGIEAAQPHDAPHRPMIVKDDFTISLPHGAPLNDRFRVERFAQWQASYPTFVYQINQRSLKRAAEAGIIPAQVTNFLSARARVIPDKVRVALQRLSAPATPPVKPGAP